MTKFELVHGLNFDDFRGDIFGGLTSAVVALPLALAFGVASGAGPVAGLYGAIFVGLFAALFGGTPAQISGPTGPMTVVMAGVITQFAHQPAIAFTVVVLTGIFQIGFGLARLGRYISLVPYPVISGFMTGIGCIIILLQLSPLLGEETPPGGTLAIIAATPELVSGVQWDALGLGFLVLAILFLTPKKLGRILPTPLIALVVGTLLVFWPLPDVPVLGDIPTGFPELSLPNLTLETIPDVVQAALVLALLGSIDSLLTSLIADNFTQSQHNSDRELIGQGIGNAVAGLFGAIPGAGATMRTVVNIRTGGRTPISGSFHAIVLLAIALGLGSLAEHIPHAVLAGILIKVGIDIIDWSYLRRLIRAPKAGVIFMLIVLGLTVFVDLITAVAVGIVLASLLFVKRMADLQLANITILNKENPGDVLTAEERTILEANDGIVLYHFNGPFGFGAARGMVRRLAAADAFMSLILDLTDVPFIDSSAALAIEDAIRQATSAGRMVFVSGLRREVESTLSRLDILDLVPKEHIAATRMAALEKAQIAFDQAALA